MAADVRPGVTAFAAVAGTLGSKRGALAIVGGRRRGLSWSLHLDHAWACLAARHYGERGLRRRDVPDLSGNGRDLVMVGTPFSRMERRA